MILPVASSLYIHASTMPLLVNPERFPVLEEVVSLAMTQPPSLVSPIDQGLSFKLPPNSFCHCIVPVLLILIIQLSYCPLEINPVRSPVFEEEDSPAIIYPS